MFFFQDTFHDLRKFFTSFSEISLRLLSNISSRFFLFISFEASSKSHPRIAPDIPTDDFPENLQRISLDPFRLQRSLQEFIKGFLQKFNKRFFEKKKSNYFSGKSSMDFDRNCLLHWFSQTSNEFLKNLPESNFQDDFQYISSEISLRK